MNKRKDGTGWYEPSLYDYNYNLMLQKPSYWYSTKVDENIKKAKMMTNKKTMNRDLVKEQILFSSVTKFNVSDDVVELKFYLVSMDQFKEAQAYIMNMNIENWTFINQEQKFVVRFSRSMYA